MTILLDKIYKEYGGKAVLENFNAEIEWDRCYAFVGPEGCGKSTILKIFMGIEQPDKGSVNRMGDYKYPTLHSAYIPQEGSLKPNKNAIWNVKKAHRWSSTKGAVEMLSYFLTEDRQNVPVSELTDIEKRYIEIVKAFVAPADFLVFDEPFDGMNDEQRKRAVDYILKERGSRPLLIASRNEAGLDFARIRNL